MATMTHQMAVERSWLGSETWLPIRDAVTCEASPHSSSLFLEPAAMVGDGTRPPCGRFVHRTTRPLASFSTPRMTRTKARVRKESAAPNGQLKAVPKVLAMVRPIMAPLVPPTSCGVT